MSEPITEPEQATITIPLNIWEMAQSRITKFEARAARLRAALEQYANTDNWITGGDYYKNDWVWKPDGNGYWIAQAALRTDEQPAAK